MMRIAEPVEQGGNSFQTQYIPARGQHGQPVQLRLNGRIGGMGVVRHKMTSKMMCDFATYIVTLHPSFFSRPIFVIPVVPAIVFSVTPDTVIPAKAGIHGGTERCRPRHKSRAFRWP